MNQADNLCDKIIQLEVVVAVNNIIKTNFGWKIFCPKKFQGEFCLLKTMAKEILAQYNQNWERSLLDKNFLAVK